jgi:hypothetical protein
MATKVEFYHSSKAETIKNLIGNKKGIYAWYYSPRLRPSDIERLLETWFHSENELKRIIENIELWIKEKYISKYEPFLNKDEWEQRILLVDEELGLQKGKKISPKIKITQEISWYPIIPKRLIKKLAEDKSAAKGFLEHLNELQGFLPPVYIGKGEGEKGIQDRLSTHIKKLQDYNEFTPIMLNSLIAGEDEDKSTDSFAVRAAYCEIKPDDLWFTFKIIDTGNSIATRIENFMNRLVNPGLGWV